MGKLSDEVTVILDFPEERRSETYYITIGEFFAMKGLMVFMCGRFGRYAMSRNTPVGER